MNVNGQPLRHGFKLIEKRFVKEINSECYYFEHVKSGAKLFKVANDDENKTFNIAFKTLPNSDNGVAHILEHSVLNGSKNFPVKSPFDILSKGSLNTFLNAMTSREMTEYPVASLNDKDYFNLMHVYLDAVLNPLIYSDPRILKQEGWHYELTDKEATPIYKGVVYNEMKGALSNPNRLLLYYNLKTLFHDNAIGKESGGIPTSIVNLTQEQFTNFHKTYYHPSNSIIFLYGNADLDKELAFIDENYLSQYTVNKNISQLQDQPPFNVMLEEHAYYPVTEGTPTENLTFLTLNYVVGESSDYALTFAFNILCEVLFNQEAAPVRQALLKAGIGQNIAAYCMDFKQNAFTVMVQNANPQDKAKFLEIVLKTLADEVKKGIDKDELRAVLNRMEFNIREGSDAQKGITYFSQIKPGWVYANNPFAGLEYEKYLETVKKGIDGRYFEDLVTRYILKNNHASVVVLEPKPGMEKENSAAEEQALIAYKNSLSDEEITQLIGETKELIAYQNEEDSPEDLAKVPMLSLSDINPKTTFYSCKEKKMGNHKIIHHEEFANSIIYSNLYFNMKVLPQELIPYAALLTNIFGILNTDNYCYGALNREINNNTGGFYTTIRTYNANNDAQKYLPYFVVSAKSFNHKSSAAFKLTSEILLNSKLSDKERLQEVLTKHLADLESFANNGFYIARARANSYFNETAAFEEWISGIEYYQFINALGKDLEANLPAIMENLERTAALLFTKENTMSLVTCSGEDFPLFERSLTGFLEMLPSRPAEIHEWTFKEDAKNEGIQSASKVQYVIGGYNFKKLGYAWNGKMRVLSQILSTDWLKNQVRVIGGAYGGFCSINLTGTMLFCSYRDPNLSRTLDVYKETGNYLRKFDADPETMTRFIIGTIAELDAPQTTEQKGRAAFHYYLTGRTEADIQKDRDAILSTTAEDIRNFAEMVDKITAQNNYCVYGNDEQIEKDQSLFKVTFNIKQGVGK